VFTIRRTDFDRFHEEQYRVRRDFDKIFDESADPKETELMLEKYELFIEKCFEPYAAMHECRTHSNLWGKHVLWGDEALATDHHGFYTPVNAHGKPTDVSFHEEYPHMVSGWVYDHHYLDAEFNYEDLEGDYLNKQAISGDSASSVKAQLDAAHKN